MNFLIPDCQTNISFQENEFTTLILERPELYSHVIGQIFSQCSGNGGEITFYEADIQFPMASTVELITNPFSIDCNENRILKNIYREISDIGMEEEWSEFSSVTGKIASLIEKLISNVPYPLIYSPMVSIDGLLKLFSVKVDQEGNFLELLSQYMKLKADVCNIKLFVLTNLKLFLNRDQLQSLLEDLMVKKIFVLLIEGNDQYERLPIEKKIIIDNDLCSIEISD